MACHSCAGAGHLQLNSAQLPCMCRHLDNAACWLLHASASMPGSFSAGVPSRCLPACAQLVDVPACSGQCLQHLSSAVALIVRITSSCISDVASCTGASADAHACLMGQPGAKFSLPCCRCWDGVHVRHLHLCDSVHVAVKLLAHCETVTLLVDDSYVLDLGPDHSPSPAGFLRLLKGTKLKQLKLIASHRWGSELIVRRRHSLMVVLDMNSEGLSYMLVKLPSAARNRRL